MTREDYDEILENDQLGNKKQSNTQTQTNNTQPVIQDRNKKIMRRTPVRKNYIKSRNKLGKIIVLVTIIVVLIMLVLLILGALRMPPRETMPNGEYPQNSQVRSGEQNNQVGPNGEQPGQLGPNGEQPPTPPAR